MSSSKLAVGIVGLPNVGKSTLFNALLRKQQAYAANFPFATIEPNIGVVPVPDERLQKLAEVVDQSVGVDGRVDPGQTQGSAPTTPIVPATVEFVDIAGLVAGAHKGEGLGNKFLAHIREVNVIAHVVRDFKNEDIVRDPSTLLRMTEVGKADPKSDLEVIETELALADLATLEKQKQPKGKVEKDDQYRWDAVCKIKPHVESGKAAREVQLSDEEERCVKSMSLLTKKPIMIVINVGEEDLPQAGRLEKVYAKEIGVEESQVIAICAKLEEELAALQSDEATVYLNEVGVEKSGLERLIKKAFETLELITFLTAGEKEVRAWTLPAGSTAVSASGVIHTDFMKKFIKADVCDFDDFIENNGWKKNRELGKVRSEGKEYVVRDGDVVEFRIGS